MFFSPHDVATVDGMLLKFIKIRQVFHVLTITLARPEKRNALTPAMVAEIAFVLAYAEAQKSIWSVVVDADGPVFCSGMDLNVLHNPALDRVNPTLPQPVREINLGEAFTSFTKPTVAKVGGAVLAGGLLITCGCTFVVATENSIFSLPEVKRGLFPFQVMASLLTVMPHSKAMQVCLLGEEYQGAAAQAMGLTSHICAPDGLDWAVEQLLATLCSYAPLAMHRGIRAAKMLDKKPVADWFDFMAGELAILKKSVDAHEGIEAFFEKRPPVWQNE